MKAYLMYRDRDFDLEHELPPNHEAVAQDLELGTLFRAMARGDEFLYRVAQVALFSGLDNDTDTILYRQDVLNDCLRHPQIVRDMYDIAVQAIESNKKVLWGIWSTSPTTILGRARSLLGLLVDEIVRLRRVVDAHAHKFSSEGFSVMFATLQQELDDDYLAVMRGHLREVRFSGGVLISADLGKGNIGTNYVLRKREDRRPGWVKHIFSSTPSYSFTIPDRDDHGARALSDLRDRGVHLVANALAQSTDHILNFFKMLRTELAFYVACLNLHERLAAKDEPICLPMPLPRGEPSLSFSGLYDVCLSLLTAQRVVGNDVNADGKNLVIITGANQGGKSTFLRSVGLAQLMMQSGMFAPAEAYSSRLVGGLFTHYKRGEDVTMESGKFDEELGRMSEIVDTISPDALMLFNESFAATNEREGSEIARQIVSALIEAGIDVFYVTHQYEFARGMYEQEKDNALFLRARRGANGHRSFKLAEGEPLRTSFGEDLYNKVFGEGD